MQCRLSRKMVSALLVAFVVLGATAVVTDARVAGEPSVPTVTDAESTPVDSCTTITESGRYVLTEDIENGGGTILSRTCIRVNASDVVLDGDGHHVDGNGVSNTTGVAVVAPNTRNVTVTDLEVRDWHRGIDYHKSACGRITGVTATNNTYGLSLEHTAGVRVADTETSRNVVGVETAWWVNRLSGVQTDGNHGVDVHRKVPSVRQLFAWMRC